MDLAMLEHEKQLGYPMKIYLRKFLVRPPNRSSERVSHLHSCGFQQVSLLALSNDWTE